ncbi:sugar ABC transporter permease [Bacillus sp. JJ1566]|uniref:carbohydrate ABC transporter permease n=1 Tax=Bacillus sp. JJ1566 TaxID=3122961 RepID=UPI002FFFBCC4
MKKRKFNVGYYYLLPAIIILIVLIGYPIIYNIVLSFQDVNLSNLGSSEKPFIGFDNYTAIFSDSLFRDAFLNTLFFTIISIILQFVIGFALALFFSLDFKLAPLLRGLTMVAWILPATVVGILFEFLFSESVGLLNAIPMMLGLIDTPIAWLSEPTRAIWAVILANVWVGIPFNMLLISTGITSLPKEIYESAAIDGATWLQRLIHITIPLLRPVLLIVAMLGFIYTFKVFDLIYVMTGGGPANSTEVLSTLSYRYSFGHFNFGLGSAVANVLLFALLIISLIYIKMTRSDEVIE